MPAAGGQNQAAGEFLDKIAACPRSRARIVQEVQAKPEKRFARPGLSTCMFQQRRDIRHLQCDADTRERPRVACCAGIISYLGIGGGNKGMEADAGRNLPFAANAALRGGCAWGGAAQPHRLQLRAGLSG